MGFYMGMDVKAFLTPPVRVSPSPSDGEEEEKTDAAVQDAGVQTDEDHFKEEEKGAVPKEAGAPSVPDPDEEAADPSAAPKAEKEAAAPKPSASASPSPSGPPPSSSASWLGDPPGPPPMPPGFTWSKPQDVGDLTLAPYLELIQGRLR